MDETEYDEIIGLEIMREIRMNWEELAKKRVQVTEQAKKIQENAKEMEDLRAKVKKSDGAVQEVKAALAVRAEATQRLEMQNATLRDTVAKLRVQVDANSAEREHLVQHWQAAETDRQNWKSKCEELRDSASGITSYKQQCLNLQNQIRSSIAKITNQQELHQKDLARLEKASQDAIAFAQSVDSRTKLQETQCQELRSIAEVAKQKLLEMTAVLAEVRRERDVLLATQTGHKEESEIFREWEKYQQKTNKRIEGMIADNARLLEELTLAKQLQDIVVCQKCLQSIPSV